MGRKRPTGGERLPARPIMRRVVAAVHPNFGGQIDIGSFGLDLLQRVAGAVVRLPPRRLAPCRLSQQFSRICSDTLGIRGLSRRDLRLDGRLFESETQG